MVSTASELEPSVDKQVTCEPPSYRRYHYKKLSMNQRFVLLSVLTPIVLSFFVCPAALAENLKGGLIYQVLTDRFANGRTDNDDPQQSKGMFDPEKKNWHAYWGGDFKGLTGKLPYIKELGATAIWITPPQDNVNKSVNDAQGIDTAPYHGYHSRDFKRVEEHFGDPDNSWKDFDELADETEKLGIKLLVDLPFNHTSPYNHGEFGALYDKGQYKDDCEYDRPKYFHHLPLVKDYNNRYDLQYGTIFYLADLDQESPYVDQYLKDSADIFRKHGADGTRLDACKHITWGWEHTLASHMFKDGDHLLLGEWWMDGINEPLIKDAAKFANNGGINLYDFPMAMEIRKAFNKEGTGNFEDLDKTGEKEYELLENADGLLTFIDNHDMPRFLSLNHDPKALHLALSLLLTSRGIPIVYYGTEQYLHNDTDKGNDPYNRPWMSSFNENSEAFMLVKTLAKLRRDNLAFAYGRQVALHTTKDMYVFKREFGGNTVIAAVNKSSTEPSCLPAFTTKLKKGKFQDCLSGKLSGVDLKVGAKGKTESMEIPPQSFSLWIGNSKSETPEIGSIRPTLVPRGAEVTIYGTGFGEERGEVFVGDAKTVVHSWDDNKVTFAASSQVSGKAKVSLKTADGKKSGSDKSILTTENELIPIRIAVEKAPLDSEEQQLFVTGDVSTLDRKSVV